MKEKEPKTAVDSHFIQAVSVIMEKLGAKEKGFSKEHFGGEQVVSKIRTGYQSATSEYIETLVTKYGISANWLFTGEGEMFIEIPTGSSVSGVVKFQSEESNIIMVPAGEEDHLTMEGALENKSYKRGYIPFLGKGTWITMQVPSDTMAPLMTYGDFVYTRVVDNGSKLESGEVYLFSTEFKKDIRRIKYKKGSDFITLIPDNLDVYEPEEMSLEDISWPIYKVEGILTNRTSPINAYQRKIDILVSDMTYVAKKAVDGMSNGLEAINQVARFAST